MSRQSELRAQIVRLGALLYNRQLAHGSAGNLSARLEDGSYLITPTNCCLGMLHADQISHVAADGTLLDGDPPSKESFFHMAVYEERPQAGAVVHLHSTYSVAVSCMCHADPANVLPPLTAYHVMKVGQLPLIDYHRPGDRKLAEAVRAAARSNHAMLMANHGPIVSAASLEQAIWTYEELEETAKLFFLLGDRRLSPLNAEQIADLNAHFPS